MPRKGSTTEQIISKLREAEILIQQGHTIGEAARKIGVSIRTIAEGSSTGALALTRPEDSGIWRRRTRDLRSWWLNSL